MAPGGTLNLPPGAGRAGEAAAAAHLEKLGLRILARNYRTREGEIDIVARDSDCFVFAEVKTRRTGSKGAPEEGLTPTKSSRLIAAAQTYLEAAGQANADWRIDLVAVELDRSGRPLRIEVIENAVTGT
jgi:putative endonuclease